jgi:hypothetical protein
MYIIACPYTLFLSSLWNSTVALSRHKAEEVQRG